MNEMNEMNKEQMIFLMESCREYKEYAELVTERNIEKCGSVFGNDFICLTKEDISNLQKGKILYLGGEYGTFIFSEDSEWIGESK